MNVLSQEERVPSMEEFDARDFGKRRRGARPIDRLWIGVALFTALLVLAFVYPHLTSISATKLMITHRFAPPVFLSGGTWQHILGTDQLGRDLFLRSLVGLQNALMISASTVFIMFVMGTLVGLVAGYYGGWIDTVLMRVTDAQLSVPLIILAITILTVSRPTPTSVILVLALSGWPVYARVSRSVMLAERRKEYVRGVKILGASDARTILEVIAPNIVPPIAFVAILDVARMMIFEAILGFIGIGVQPPTPTFGNIIADGTQYLINYWWIATMPGFFLFLCLLAINLIGAAYERARHQLFGGVI
jgi:peptide/nickel transport system permease protein